MKYIPIPLALMHIGESLSVNLWSASGNLLLLKGQPIISEQHRDKLHAHQASATLADSETWDDRARQIKRVLQGSSLDSSPPISGGWLELNEALHSVLYQGELANSPLRRLERIKEKVLDLLDSDPDDSLFCLFQAMTDEQLGYCATHSLQCAVVCKLTAEKLAMSLPQRKSLVNAALTMNIGMAREQDIMTRQIAALNTEQKSIILAHPQKSVEMLRGLGVLDEDQIDIVRWHHSTNAHEGMAHTRSSRQILIMADRFLARMAIRKTRSSMSPVAAVKSIVMGAQGDALNLGTAMAQAVGFYPPGSYVKLITGETAVSVRRGERANTPWVIIIIDKDGMPSPNYQCCDTTLAAFAIVSPVSWEKVRVNVNLEKMRKARAAIGR